LPGDRGGQSLPKTQLEGFKGCTVPVGKNFFGRRTAEGKKRGSEILLHSSKKRKNNWDVERR